MGLHCEATPLQVFLEGEKKKARGGGKRERRKEEEENTFVSI